MFALAGLRAFNLAIITIKVTDNIIDINKKYISIKESIVEFIKIIPSIVETRDVINEIILTMPIPILILDKNNIFTLLIIYKNTITYYYIFSIIYYKPLLNNSFASTLTNLIILFPAFVTSCISPFPPILGVLPSS